MTTAPGYPTPPSINLTQRQIMLSFAYLAYTGEGLTTPDAAQTISTNINAVMPQIPPIAKGWNIVWGPSLYTVPGAFYQDNMMYVVQNTAIPSQYVIAIRGTNFISTVDWFLEDFNVIQTMNWPVGATTPNPNGDLISESTCISLQILLNMQDTLITNSSLLNYLLSITKKGPVNICVTGHSLGGLLCSTLAFYLLENQASPSNWDSSGKSTVTCISFAGPTAGNLQFANDCNAAFAAANTKNPPPATVWDNTLQTNCDIIQNAYDIAPLMYNSGNIAGITGTYGDNIPFNQLTGDNSTEYDAFLIFLFEISNLTSTQNYTQLNVANPGGNFPGVFNPPLPPAPSTNPSFLTYIEAFVAQATWQHSYSYPNIFALTELLDPSIIVRGFLQLTGISPNSGITDNTYPVTITGSGFLALQNVIINVTKEIGYADITVTDITVVSDTEITASFALTATILGHGDRNISVSGYTGQSLGFTTSNTVIFDIT